MFTNAYKINSQYTKPLMVALRFQDKTVESGLGSFIVLNEEGWIMTAAHNIQPYFTLLQHNKEIEEYNEKVKKIAENPRMDDRKKKLALSVLKPNKKWITNFALLLAGVGVEMNPLHMYGDHDIAFAKIDPKHIAGMGVTTFPKFKNPSNFEHAKSLCKLGYPFFGIKATFDEAKNLFDFSNLPPTVPLFPIEGIYTRNLISGVSQHDGREILFLETSSPGLKGQSGGPIFDGEGNIWAVQSRNSTIPLGFKGEVEVNGKKVQQEQFINIGMGVHGKTIVDLLNHHGINHTIAN